ncbi:MAG: hydrolase [Acidimicrobiales bacterium]|nr:MAG: hydrolase [Acidimicrobiales bacterium]
MSSTLLQQVTIVHAAVTDQPHDVLIVDGVIAEIAPSIAATADETLDLAGYLLSPSAVEPHAHLDKAFLAEQVPNAAGDLMGAIEAMGANRHLLDVEHIVERAERAARLMASNGYRFVRTHADLTTDHGLRSVEALGEVRRRVADIIDVEIVALCDWPVVGQVGADQRALLHDALDAGADLVGGCPHLEGGGDTRRATEVFLQIATDHGVGVDLHTDETLDPDVLGLVDLAELVLAGFEHPVTASHCVSLGMQDSRRQAEIAELVATAGISVIALPHTNLFLQGRGQAPMPRGLTAVAALSAAGANVAAGADNLQDPFNPVGRACPFETAGLMIMTSHLLPDEAWASVTDNAAAATNAGAAACTAGSPADLVAIRATTVREAIAFGSPDRLVWRNGVRIGETRS